MHGERSRPAKKGKGRTIADIFAHLHNNRFSWLKHSAPHLECPAPLAPDHCTMKQAAAAHKKSSTQCLMLAHQLGYPVPDEAMYGIWQWDKLWKRAGLSTRPR